MVALKLADTPAVDERTTKVNWSLVLTVVGLLVGWMLGAFSDNRTIVSRITALESQRTADKDRQDRMESSVNQRLDRVESKIDRLLERDK